MSFFNDAQIKGMYTNKYPCPNCGSFMKWEDDWEETLVCCVCGFSVSSDEYGFKNDKEYESLYPTMEEVCGYENTDDDEYNGESYDEVYGELSDD